MCKKILIVEDEYIVAGDIRITLENAGYKVCGIAFSVDEALQMIATEKPCLIVLDIYLQGDRTGIDLALLLNEMNLPFIYLSANSSAQVLQAAKATNPYGFLVKPFREKDLLVTLDIAQYRHHYDQQQKARSLTISDFKSTFKTTGLEKPDDEEIKTDFEGIIGTSRGMQEVFELVRQVAASTTSVLILGESGTGKEGIASIIHKLSPRRNRPFIKVNCAALPPNLIESEFFGHEKGSFTGAYEKRIGKFEQASGGTIMLDEIGEMPLDFQVKLLRVLQEKEIERIGGRGSIKVDVRIVAATSRDLEKEIASGRFRLDLYYRLFVFPIMLPPLRERPEDIPLLAHYFFKHYAKLAGKRLESISKYALDQLTTYSWPGNVRELQHLIERSVLMASGNQIEEILLPPSNEAKVENIARRTDSPVKTMEELERDHILSVLKKCNNRISGPNGAAVLLDLPVSTMVSKMKKLGIVKSNIS
ncbi:DNA-binding transcriptional response regulator, NtrC family, contains REC, AAA-type ATPase, and a Fis-type DNA-binding domains [Dyadobacter koreensis]|uniref:DNA-binding transcriptional response regulator, NtrC family, contains REC, AAA-type ATPase, and a Fis-type DNA-binding domains n=1 Tax=Dyadobacter koreensis TaxID=408657 RepID=A0A1H6V7E1_9BACT|nr:sigma-54 dependent transcriptional regulator [Dyadobacter koreensis]SEJ00438.1 DNA-binding transcriptional response regulator, NtrC family, contains REC, AAA-type ATPase, and a Fis-type DNA-binding domains [Dyadobacter koreensis]